METIPNETDLRLSLGVLRERLAQTEANYGPDADAVGPLRNMIARRVVVLESMQTAAVNQQGQPEQEPQ